MLQIVFKTTIPIFMIQSLYNKANYVYNLNFSTLPLKIITSMDILELKYPWKLPTSFFKPYLEKWLSKFIHDCIECQQNNHKSHKLQIASMQIFSENASYISYRIAMVLKWPINSPSQQISQINVIVDAFIRFAVTIPKLFITSLDNIVPSSSMFSYRPWFRLYKQRIRKFLYRNGN